MTSFEFNRSWEQTVIDAVAESAFPAQTFKKLAVDGMGAWKLLLNLNSSSQVLEIGAGEDSQIHHLANCSEHLYLIDEDSSRLEFSRKRHRQPPDVSVNYLQCDSQNRLPFADHSLDCVILSRPSLKLYQSGYLDFIKRPLGIARADQPSMRLLKECRRILKPSGQLLATWDNLLAFDKLSPSQLLTGPQSTRFGYQRLLKSAGFKQWEVHSFEHCSTHLLGLSPVKAHNTQLAPQVSSTSKGLKQKIKNSPYLTATFTFIASPEEAPRHNLLEQIVKEASGKLAHLLGPGELHVNQHEITRKEKLVISASWNNQPVILKLPLNKNAFDSEANNVAMLNRLAQTAAHPELFARSLCRGTIYKQPYFVETRLVGTPLSHQLKQQGRLAFLDQILSLLEQLTETNGNCDRAPTPLLGDVYQQLVQERINWIYRSNGDEDLKNRLEAYFGQKLKGVSVRLGILHGDFSVSNLFTQNNRICGLIDWETGDQQGIAILDAINYLDSVQRLFNPGMRINQSIPLQASGNWPVAEEQIFLKRCFELYAMDPGDQEALVYLRWLRHVSYLMGYWLRFNRQAQQVFIYDIAKQLPIE